MEEEEDDTTGDCMGENARPKSTRARSRRTLTQILDFIVLSKIERKSSSIQESGAGGSEDERHGQVLHSKNERRVVEVKIVKK